VELLDRLPISRKLSTDIGWNTVSFGIMGIVGVLLNIVVARYYGAAVLGVFNQVYAIYILLSQFAVGGVHLSTLKSISQLPSSSWETSDVFLAGLFSAAATAGLVTVVAFSLKDLFGVILSSDGVSIGILYVLPGLFFFSLNKVCLAFINGRRQMKAFAVFQALRFVLLLIFLLLLTALSVAGDKLSAIFSLAEIVLFVFVFGYSLRIVKLRFSGAVIEWIKKHLNFGFRAAGGNILLEVNSRVDVIILGGFASDSLVGVYSFAAMLADGFNQLPAVLRTNVNPIITQTMFNQGQPALEAAVRQGRSLSYKFLVPIGIVAVLCFPVINLLNASPEFSQAWGAFTILMTGILLSAGYLPFQMILNQTGYPGYHTLYLTLFFCTNVMLNLMLVPLLGMYGSALATAAAFVLQVFYLKLLTYKAVGIRI
jgi:O-antigen/teichoic acid export membrane protein